MLSSHQNRGRTIHTLQRFANYSNVQWVARQGETARLLYVCPSAKPITRRSLEGAGFSYLSVFVSKAGVFRLACLKRLLPGKKTRFVARGVRGMNRLSWEENGMAQRSAAHHARGLLRKTHREFHELYLSSRSKANLLRRSLIL
jgi:hypothetical protein